MKVKIEIQGARRYLEHDRHLRPPVKVEAYGWGAALKEFGADWCRSVDQVATELIEGPRSKSGRRRQR